MTTHHSKIFTQGLKKAGNVAHLKNTGLTDADFSRPFIGVINSLAERHPGQEEGRSCWTFIKNLQSMGVESSLQ